MYSSNFKSDYQLFQEHCVFYNHYKKTYVLKFNNVLYEVMLNNSTPESFEHLKYKEIYTIKELDEHAFIFVDFIKVNNNLYYVCQVDIE